MYLNLVFHHILWVKNQIADCMSPLKRRIREAEHFTLNDPLLGDYSTVNKIALKSQVESDDPWDKKLAVSAMADPEYVIMVTHILLLLDNSISHLCRIFYMEVDRFSEKDVGDDDLNPTK